MSLHGGSVRRGGTGVAREIYLVCQLYTVSFKIYCLFAEQGLACLIKLLATHKANKYSKI